MAVNSLTTKQRLWIKIGMAILAVIAIILIVKSRHAGTPSASDGDLEKMMGIKSTPVEELKSYQKIDGVLNIQHWVTEHGTSVYFVPVRTLPMVDVEVIFDAGAARNEGKGGLAYLTNSLLSEGTLQMSADQIAENFDHVGAQFSAESQRDMAIVHLRSLSDPSQLAVAVKTMEAVLTQPNFPEVSFKREQQNALSALKQQAQRPQHVASRAFYSMLYERQPYSNWVLGEEASINALTLQDVKDFYQKYYNAKNATVAIVGDLTAQDADAIAQSVTNGLPKGEKATPIPPVADLKEKVVKKIDFPSAQTTVLMGTPGMKRDDPDFYALMVGNHILGGNGSVTRIYSTIRNQHGLAYSAYSYFIPMHERGPFVLGLQTRNDQAPKAQAMMEELLKDFVAQGPTYKELEQAKQNLVGGYALQFDSNASICHELAALGFYQLPLNYFNDFKEKVNKLTADDIKEAFQKRITPDKVAIVMVGGAPDPDKVNSKLDTDVPTGPSPDATHGNLPGGHQH